MESPELATTRTSGEESPANLQRSVLDERPLLPRSIFEKSSGLQANHPSESCSEVACPHSKLQKRVFPANPVQFANIGMETSQRNSRYFP
jgi:hypothetical protein